MKLFVQIATVAALMPLSAVDCSAEASETHAIVSRIDATTLQSMSDVLTWQRSFIDLSQQRLKATLGAPDRTEQLEVNAVTKKPMQTLVYRLTKNSDVRFTIHDGSVAAAVIILMPSENENEPKR